MNGSIAYETIYRAIESEDRELTELSKQGIFYTPELYIAIVIGKALKKKENEIFGEITTWIRETDFKNGGPTDFAFQLENERVLAFELKLRQTIHDYQSDIDKLKKLDSKKYDKYFVALVDSWAKDRENDARIIGLEKNNPELNRIAAFKSFPTAQTRYSGNITCTLAVWNVN